MKKKTIFCIVLFCIITNISFSRAEESDYELLVNKINDYAKEEVENKFESITTLLWDDPDTDISGKKEAAQLGNPFIYYDANRGSNQNMDFHYPVMIKGKVVGIIEAISYQEDWTLSISDINNDFKLLNEIDYNHEQPLFYILGSDVFMETAKSSIKFTNLLDSAEETSLQKEFSQKSYIEKMKEIVRNTKNFHDGSQGLKAAKASQEEKTDSHSIKNNSQNFAEGKWLYASIVVIILIIIAVLLRKKGV